MKQMLKYAIVFLAGAICATAGSAYGAEAIKTISAKLRPDIKVSVNGKQLDASAISYNNTTYLPLRKAAEAVGGKIELNGKNINIVTNSSAAEPKSINGSTESAETTNTLESKVLHQWNEVYSHLYSTDRPRMKNDVINGKLLVYYNNNTYLVTDGVDYYYDRETDKSYYTREFLLQFLPSTDLNGVPSYHLSGKVIIPI
jgi:hypothetical protein